MSEIAFANLEIFKNEQAVYFQAEICVVLILTIQHNM